MDVLSRHEQLLADELQKSRTAPKHKEFNLDTFQAGSSASTFYRQWMNLDEKDPRFFQYLEKAMELRVPLLLRPVEVDSVHDPLSVVAIPAVDEAPKFLVGMENIRKSFAPEKVNHTLYIGKRVVIIRQENAEHLARLFYEK